MTFAGITAAAICPWKSLFAPATTRGLNKGIRSVVTVPQADQGQKWMVEPYNVVTAGTPLAVISPVDHRGDCDLLRLLFEMTRVHAQLSDQPTEITPAFQDTPQSRF